MCTVSYVPLKNNLFVLTSNRDESNERPTSPPEEVIINQTKVFFPRDMQAGGTWVAVGNNGRICCLLNGAFKLHERKLPYGKSRGKLILKSFEYKNINEFFYKVDLREVEPFTLIIIDGNKNPNIWEFRWDAAQKFIKKLESNQKYIWSSATLYNDNIRDQKEEWFIKYLNDTTNNTTENIFKFHSSFEVKIDSNMELIKRYKELQTVSTTQVTIHNNEFKMTYQDFVNNKITIVGDQLKLI